MRNVPGYNPKDAITRILNKTTHLGFDNPWKAFFQKLARQLGGKTITAQKFFDTVSKPRSAIRISARGTRGRRSSCCATSPSYSTRLPRRIRHRLTAIASRSG